jgi:hypothetical protein
MFIISFVGQVLSGCLHVQSYETKIKNNQQTYLNISEFNLELFCNKSSKETA